MKYKTIQIISGRGLDIFKGIIEINGDGICGEELLEMVEEMEESGRKVSDVRMMDEVDGIVGCLDVSWEELENKFKEGCNELYEGNKGVMESVEKGLKVAVEGKLVDIM